MSIKTLYGCLNNKQYFKTQYLYLSNEWSTFWWILFNLKWAQRVLNKEFQKHAQYQCLRGHGIEVTEKEYLENYKK